MSEHKILRPGISLLSVLFVTGLLAGPAQANHDHETNVILPLATGIVLGSILFHGHNHQQYYAKRRYGHHSGYSRHDYSHRGYKQHARSRSYGGHSRRSGHSGYQPGHGGKKHHSKRKH